MNLNETNTYSSVYTIIHDYNMMNLRRIWMSPSKKCSGSFFKVGFYLSYLDFPGIPVASLRFYVKSFYSLCNHCTTLKISVPWRPSFNRGRDEIFFANVQWLAPELFIFWYIYIYYIAEIKRLNRTRLTKCYFYAHFADRTKLWAFIYFFFLFYHPEISRVSFRTKNYYRRVFIK